MNRTACACVVALGTLAPLPAAPPAKKAVPTKPSHPITNPSPPLTQEHQTAQQLYATALKDFSDGNLESAKLGFKRVLAIALENPPALINLALIAQRQEHGEPVCQSRRRVIIDQRSDREHAAHLRECFDDFAFGTWACENQG